MKPLLQELEYLPNIKNTKSKASLDWANGVKTLNKRIELFNPENRPKIKRFVLSGGKIKTVEWLFLDIAKMQNSISLTPNYIKASDAEVKDIFGGDVKLARLMSKIAHQHFSNGNFALIAINSAGRVQSIAGFVKSANKTYHVETAISIKNPEVKLHEIYASLIKKADVILTTSSQSEGGVILWKRLSAVPGIVVHGWDTAEKKPINLGSKFEDEWETHDTGNYRFSDMDSNDSSLHNLSDRDMEEFQNEKMHRTNIYRNVILVASKKR